MVDNFEQIKQMFYFDKEDNLFFHCQIVQRAKDHKPNKVKEGALRVYFIRSAEQLESLRDEIILLCNHHKARAYINLAGKDFDTINKSLLVKLATDIQLGVISNPGRSLNSVAGQCKAKLPKWIVDIDDMSTLPAVQQWLQDWFRTNPSKRGVNPGIYATIPTVYGVHLITAPFNTQAFGEQFPDIDIHKNSMGTLLYCPDI